METKKKENCVPEAFSYIISIAIGEELTSEQLAKKVENMHITLNEGQNNLNYQIIE